VINGYDADPTVVAEMPVWSELYTNDDDGVLSRERKMGSEIASDGQPSTLAGADLNLLTIGLIDCNRLSQECLTEAFEGLHSRISIFSFTTMKDCLVEARDDLDLIIYYLHGSDVSEAPIVQSVATICQAFPAIPVIVFSDTDSVHQSKIMRIVLKGGARGFVPTQTASLPITLAAIRFVKAGGTFAPVDLLLTSRPDRVPARQNRLTSRQMAVLSHLQQGKANKIIAYELGMSESTVKVHVRNIMRKMGATNRTQAAYKAQNLLNDFDGLRTVSA
jgi:DNA-binding NarL/FixJ family response regulator